MSGTSSDELITGNTMIKELAKTIVKDKVMNSAIASSEKYADYLIALYYPKLRKHLDNSKSYTCYEPNTVRQIHNEILAIEDEHSRNLLQEECSQLLLMNSLEEIL